MSSSIFSSDTADVLLFFCFAAVFGFTWATVWSFVRDNKAAILLFLSTCLHLEEDVDDMVSSSKDLDAVRIEAAKLQQGRIDSNAVVLREIEKAQELAGKARKVSTEFERLQASRFSGLRIWTRYWTARKALALKAKMEKQKELLIGIGVENDATAEEHHGEVVQVEEEEKVLEEGDVVREEEEETVLEEGEVVREEEEEKVLEEGEVVEEKGEEEFTIRDSFWISPNDPLYGWVYLTTDDPFPVARVRVWNDLQEDSNVGFVGVYGMGGIGKTKLLEDVCSRFTREPNGYKVIMIQVTEQLDIDRIREEIGRALDLDWSPQDDAKKRASDIFRTITEKQRCIILFDDVWEEIPFSTIGIPSPKLYGLHCKLVLATRIASLCKAADAVYHLGGFGWQQSWSLLERVTGMTIDKSVLSFNYLCGGLPLALVTLGKVFLGVPHISEETVWKVLLGATDFSEETMWDMVEEPWKIQAFASDVLSVLQRSYDHLDSEAAKAAFTYFVLYPRKGFISETILELEWLTDYLIGEGFISDFKTMDEAHEQRDRILEKLTDVGLLVDNRDLHKFVRAMAFRLGIQTQKWMMLPKMSSVVPPELPLVERMSSIQNIVTEWPETPDFPNLKTLLLWGSIQGFTSFHQRFFHLMNSLVVLELSSCSLEELPSSIGELRLLRFLDVSNSAVKSLPLEMGELGNLVFLNLQRSRELRTIPHGIFGRLTKLLVLRMAETYGGWGMDADGAKIEELYALTQLVELDITIEDADALQALVASTHLQAVTRSLYLKHLRQTKAVQLPADLGEHMKRLQRLKMSECPDLEELLFDAGDGEGPIENLRQMELDGLDKVRISWKGRGPVECLRKLEELRISACGNMNELLGEEVVEDVDGGLFAFPQLSVLSLVRLPKMERIAAAPLVFPSLKNLSVDGCPGLKRLPLGYPGGGKLSTISGSQEWWDGLDWVGLEDFRRQYERCFQSL